MLARKRSDLSAARVRSGGGRAAAEAEPDRHAALDAGLWDALVDRALLEQNQAGSRAPSVGGTMTSSHISARGLTAVLDADKHETWRRLGVSRPAGDRHGGRQVMRGRGGNGADETPPQATGIPTDQRQAAAILIETASLDWPSGGHEGGSN